MTTKIPKRIAGVKLNKKLRKRGNELLAMADTPKGRETIAMGLSMAAAAASVALKKRSSDAEHPRAAPPSDTPTSDNSRETATTPDPAPFDAEKIIAAVGQTIDTAMTRFFASTKKH